MAWVVSFAIITPMISKWVVSVRLTVIVEEKLARMVSSLDWQERARGETVGREEGEDVGVGLIRDSRKRRWILRNRG